MSVTVYVGEVRRSNNAGAMPVALLTRFAVKPDPELQVFSKATETEVWRSEAWLESRLVSFQRYTLPSISNQIDQDFFWFVGIDASLPRRFKGQLREAIGARGTLLEVPANSTFNSAVTQKLKTLGPLCITGRLDSDDAVSRRFIGVLRDRCRKVGHVYNFPAGLGLFAARGIVVRKWIRSNPFIATLSEPQRHVLTLGLHSAVASRSQVHEVATWSPMYLKVYTADMTSNFPQNGWAIVTNPSRKLAGLFGVVIARAGYAGLRFRVRFSLSWVGRTAGIRFPLVRKIWYSFNQTFK